MDNNKITIFDIAKKQNDLIFFLDQELSKFDKKFKEQEERISNLEKLSNK